MEWARSALVLVVTAVTIGGCGIRTSGLSLGSGVFGGGAPEAAEESTGAVPVAAPAPTRMAIATAKPVDAYVMLGGRIKTCWFNADAPLLPNHVYRADVSPDGDKVQITIHQKIALGRAGLQTYAIDFSQQGAYTVVTTQNRSMPPELAAKMQYDIERWKRGETNCSKEMPKVTASAPAPAAR
jgi:hypothetical protein